MRAIRRFNGIRERVEKGGHGLYLRFNGDGLLVSRRQP
jgi:hypothetical protein